MESISLNGRGRPYNQEDELSSQELETGQILAAETLANGAWGDGIEIEEITERRRKRRNRTKDFLPFDRFAGFIALADVEGRVTHSLNNLLEVSESMIQMKMQKSDN